MTAMRFNVKVLWSDSRMYYFQKRGRSDFARMKSRQRKLELKRQERTYDEQVTQEMTELKNLDKAPYEAENWKVYPQPNYHRHQADPKGGEKRPFVRGKTEPYPIAPFNEVRPEPLLVWNDFQERYELRDKRILSEKTKQTLLSMHRRFPIKYNKENLSREFGLSIETIDFIFWEDEMRRKFKIPYDLDTIKLLEAYCGTDELLESRTYAMMAYSQVTGDPYFTAGRLRTGSPLLLPTEELDEYLYSWQQRQQHTPSLRKDHYELIPQNGTGSGKMIVGANRLHDKSHSYMVVDTGDDDVRKFHDEHMNVKIREANGNLRWGTVEECNFAHMKEYPKGISPHDRIRTNKIKQLRPKRKFPKRPYLDIGFVEHHWW